MLYNFNLNKNKNFIENYAVSALHDIDIIFNSIIINNNNIDNNKYYYFNDSIYFKFNLFKKKNKKIISLFNLFINKLKFIKILKNNILKLNISIYIKIFNKLNLKYKILFLKIIKNFFLKKNFKFNFKYRIINVINNEFNNNNIKYNSVYNFFNLNNTKNFKKKNNTIFSEELFGPIYSYRCKCNFSYNIDIISKEIINNKKYNYRCLLCGVEFISSSVRSYRSALLKLNTIILNPNFLNLLPDVFLKYLTENILKENKNKLNSKKKIKIKDDLYINNYLNKIEYNNIYLFYILLYNLLNININIILSNLLNDFNILNNKINFNENEIKGYYNKKNNGSIEIDGYNIKINNNCENNEITKYNDEIDNYNEEDYNSVEDINKENIEIYSRDNNSKSNYNNIKYNYDEIENNNYNTENDDDEIEYNNETEDNDYNTENDDDEIEYDNETEDNDYNTENDDNEIEYNNETEDNDYNTENDDDEIEDNYDNETKNNDYNTENYYYKKNYNEKKKIEDEFDSFLFNPINCMNSSMELFKFLLNIKINKITIDSFFLKYITIIPPALRESKKINMLDNNASILTTEHYLNNNINDYYNTLILHSNEISHFNLNLNKNIYFYFKNFKIKKIQNIVLYNNRKYFENFIKQLKPNTSDSKKLTTKEGLFRLNILGKRVDFSARSIISTDSHVKNYKIKLPYTLGVTLFKEHIKLILSNYYENLNNKYLIYLNSFILKYILNLLYNSKLVLLNRAPTLHRFNIQSFKPSITNSKTIIINPLACEGFNADFDGDQMGVYFPLSLKSQLEVKYSLNFKYNILQFKNNSLLKNFKQNSLYGLDYFFNLNINYFNMSNYIILRNIYDFYFFKLNTDYNFNCFFWLLSKKLIIKEKKLISLYYLTSLPIIQLNLLKNLFK